MICILLIAIVTSCFSSNSMGHSFYDIRAALLKAEGDKKVILLYCFPSIQQENYG